MKKKQSTRTTKVDPYEAYVKQYKANVEKVSRYDNPVTADKIQERMATRAQFEGSLKAYRRAWQEKHPGSHGESADRIAKWVANRETEDKSYKHSLKIRQVAKELGWDLSVNDVRFGSAKTAQFWNDYSFLLGEGVIDTNMWGS